MRNRRRSPTAAHNPSPPGAAMTLLALATCWAAPVAAQSTSAGSASMGAFLALFKGAVEKMETMAGKPLAERVKVGHGTLQDLQAAAGMIDALPVAAERRDQLRFFVGVRQAEVYWRLGSEEARAKAVEVGLRVRREASAAKVYKTYYRAVLLILLSSTMPERKFLAMLEDGCGDAAYLRGAASQRDVEKLRKGLSSYAGYLALLRGWIDLTRRPAEAVRALQELGLQLKQLGEGARTVRDECFSRLAWHFMELRDFDRARVYLGEVTAEESRYPRAVIDYKQGAFEACREEAQRLYTLEKRPEFAQLLANAEERLAQVARTAGDESRAKRLWSQASRHFKEAVAWSRGDPLTSAAGMNGRGDCFLGLGQLDAAEKSYRQSLELLATAGGWTDQAERAETWKDLGRLAERRGQPAQALEHFSCALDEVEGIRRAIPLDALGIAWLEPGQLEAVDGVLRLCSAGPVPPLQALLTVDRMKARGLLDWCHRPPSPGDLGSYRAALGDLARARSAADVRRHRLNLEQARAAAGDRDQAPPLDEAKLRRVLEQHRDTVFLSYWTGKGLGEPVYVIRARGAAIRVFALGSVAAAKAHEAAARDAMASPGTDPWKALDAAATFFLPDEVVATLPRGCSVVVSADSPFGELPFEALRIDGEPLGLRHVVYRAPSLAVMDVLDRRQRGGPRRPERALIFDSAASTDGDRVLHGLSDLEFSAAEGDLVERAHGSHERRSAERACFVELADVLRRGQFDLLHVSCHAINNQRIPSASLLMLSDGPLDMATLATLPMDRMLVIFSSCRSAGRSGNSGGGEGVKGLLWGPLAAGAGAVVASHWEMNQQATKDLMGQFHAALATGADVGEAMRRARATLAAAANYAHPAYWAGFGVFAAPLAEAAVASVAPRGNLVAYGIGGAGLVLLLLVVWLARRR